MREWMPGRSAFCRDHGERYYICMYCTVIHVFCPVLAMAQAHHEIVGHHGIVAHACTDME